MSLTGFQAEGLELLGYSRRESEFLFLVATHSGYFTNHQFKAFLPTESGSVSHAFIRKLLEHKHATFRAYRSGERVYHLFARKLYHAMDRANFRTRKKHELEYVKTRLVTLDFVLGHQEHRYLETETEKVEFFERQFRVPRALQPVKLYRARRSADVTPRYFVDRFPLFVAGNRPAFTYVEAGAVTLDAFRTHLHAYLRLFEALPAFDFVYVAHTPRLFEAAAVEFERIVNRHRDGTKPVSLLHYFRLRKAWDTRERVASADVVLLKEARDCYTQNGIEQLFERWQKGMATESEINEVGGRSSHAPRAVFQTHVCGASLKVFADPVRKTTESYSSRGLPASVAEVSVSDSAQVSRP